MTTLAPPLARRRSRLGWLGPAIVLVGAIVAAVGVWYMVAAKPRPGAVIDTLAIDDGISLVVLAEANGERNFVELRRGETTLWQAYIPPYAGRPGAPGIAWNEKALTVRVLRSGRAEIFALAMRDGSKLGGFRLAPNHTDPIRTTNGPVTLTNHVQAFEVVAGADWQQLVGVDLATGEGLWRQELGIEPVTAGGATRDQVWIEQGGRTRTFDALTGAVR